MKDICRLHPRVSSRKQLLQGDSVKIQEDKLVEHSKQNNDNVVGIHTDAGKSATISDENIEIWHKEGFIYAKINIKKRKGINEILDLLNDDDWNCLKITKWDRFSRNNLFSKLMQIYFERNNKKIIAIDDSSDPLMIEIKGVLSEEEIRKMKERVRDTRLSQFEKGIIVGRCPVGYLPIFKNKRDRRGITGIKIDPKKVSMIQDVFFLTSQGKSYKEICDKWKLKPQSYYNIIRNKIYIGIVEFEGNEKKGIHESIISEELFNKVNKNGS